MRILKWLGITMLSIFALCVVAVGVVWALGGRKAAEKHEVAVAPVAIPAADSAVLARGRHLARALGKCADCHGEDLGGTTFIDGNPFAVVPAPNLTRGRGGSGATYSDLDFVRVIRHGIQPDGRAAIIMPSEAYRWMSDDDLGALIAYIRSVPPVDREWPDPKLGIIGRMLLVTGQAPLLPATTYDQTRADVPAAVTPDTSAAYGHYLARISGCTTCHGENLSGRPPMNGDPNAKLSSNLTPGGIGEWTIDDFTRALRDGIGMGGRTLDTLVMPVKWTREMTDAEIQAVWAFLRSVPAKQFGEQ